MHPFSTPFRRSLHIMCRVPRNRTRKRIQGIVSQLFEIKVNISIGCRKTMPCEPDDTTNGKIWQVLDQEEAEHEADRPLHLTAASLVIVSLFVVIVVTGDVSNLKPLSII
jgi:hypothetical protein